MPESGAGLLPVEGDGGPADISRCHPRVDATPMRWESRDRLGNASWSCKNMPEHSAASAGDVSALHDALEQELDAYQQHLGGQWASGSSEQNLPLHSEFDSVDIDIDLCTIEPDL